MLSCRSSSFSFIPMVLHFTSMMPFFCPQMFNNKGEAVPTPKHYTAGLVNEAIGGLTTMAFHPLRPQLATSSTAAVMAVFAPTSRR
eukprot:m.878343 g.878343  ORF g.878343 m.878343 type:complete len:86 (+) comp59834_c0_seq6:103-360(+)